VTYERRVLDGRNRERACRDAGVPTRYVAYNGDTPVAYVISANLHRRHLTDDQAAIAAGKVRELFAAEAKARQREHGGTAPGRKRSLPLKSGEVIPVDPHEREATAQAAKAAGVSRSRVERASAIARADPERAQLVLDGALTVREAENQIAAEQGEKAIQAVDTDGSIARKRILAAYTKAMTSLSTLLALDVAVVAGELDEGRRAFQRDDIARIQTWFGRLDKALSRGVHVVK
jgi:hypothetical protein